MTLYGRNWPGVSQGMPIWRRSFEQKQRTKLPSGRTWNRQEQMLKIVSGLCNRRWMTTKASLDQKNKIFSQSWSSFGLSQPCGDLETQKHGKNVAKVLKENYPSNESLHKTFAKKLLSSCKKCEIFRNVVPPLWKRKSNSWIRLCNWKKRFESGNLATPNPNPKLGPCGHLPLAYPC